MRLELVHSKNMANVSKYPNGVPKELHQQIIDYYLAGNSAYKTGKHFGISDFTVSTILKKYGIPRRSKTLKRDAEIIPLYESGMNAPQIEAKLGLSASHVYDVLRRHKIKADPYNSGVASNLSAEQKNEIIKLYNEGKSAPALGKMFGVNGCWVRRFLARNGIKLRSASERIGALSHRWKGGLTKDTRHRRNRTNEYNRNRRKSDPIFALEVKYRGLVNHAIKSGKYQKNSRVYFLLGADFLTVKSYIESQFKDGMTWGNWGMGNGKWCLDHAIPCASAKTEEELLRIFRYKNLQPLWFIENIKKSSWHNGIKHKRMRRVS